MLRLLTVDKKRDSLTCEDPEEEAGKLQISIIKINFWTNRWRNKLNETKSIHVNFANKKKQHTRVSVNNIGIYSTTAKNLGETLDAWIRWRAHVKKKR